MDRPEALGLIFGVAGPKAGVGVGEVAWPQAIQQAIIAAEGDSVLGDRLTEAVAALTGLPYDEMLTVARALGFRVVTDEQAGQIILVARDMCEECDELLGNQHAESCTRSGEVTEDEATSKMTTLAKVEEDYEQRLRHALGVIGEWSSPNRPFIPEDPYVWAVDIVSAAVNTESNGDPREQDRLIEAIATVLRSPTGEGHGLTVEQMIMRVMGKG